MRNWGSHWRNFRDYLLRTPRLNGWSPDRTVRDYCDLSWRVAPVRVSEGG